MKLENILQKNNKALTLIELVVVISIFGIILLLSVSFLGTYQPTLQLNGSVRELISDLRQAQQLTVTEQVEHSIYFSTSTNRYEIIRYGAATSTVKEVTFPLEITEIIIIGLSDINGGKEARYNPYGAIIEEGTVTLKNSKDATTTVEIRPSGFVRTGN